MVRSRRLWLAASLSLTLVVGALMPRSAAAYVGGCRTDPILYLSNGAQVTITSTIGDDPSDIRQVLYVVHAPAGTTLLSVADPTGTLNASEVVAFSADNAPDTYDTGTMVTTFIPGRTVSTTTSVSSPALGPASASGFTGQYLPVHLGS
jgi:hypothetical protein